MMDGYQRPGRRIEGPHQKEKGPAGRWTPGLTPCTRGGGPRMDGRTHAGCSLPVRPRDSCPCPERARLSSSSPLLPPTAPPRSKEGSFGTREVPGGHGSRRGGRTG